MQNPVPNRAIIAALALLGIGGCGPVSASKDPSESEGSSKAGFVAAPPAEPVNVSLVAQGTGNLPEADRKAILRATPNLDQVPLTSGWMKFKAVVNGKRSLDAFYEVVPTSARVATYIYRTARYDYYLFGIDPSSMPKTAFLRMCYFYNHGKASATLKEILRLPPLAPAKRVIFKAVPPSPVWPGLQVSATTGGMAGAGNVHIEASAPLANDEALIGKVLATTFDPEVQGRGIVLQSLLHSSMLPSRPSRLYASIYNPATDLVKVRISREKATPIKKVLHFRGTVTTRFDVPQLKLEPPEAIPIAPGVWATLHGMDGIPIRAPRKPHRYVTLEMNFVGRVLTSRVRLLSPQPSECGFQLRVRNMDGVSPPAPTVPDLSGTPIQTGPIDIEVEVEASPFVENKAVEIVLPIKRLPGASARQAHMRRVAPLRGAL